MKELEGLETKFDEIKVRVRVRVRVRFGLKPSLDRIKAPLSQGRPWA